jgi:hypothetical protein
MMFSENLMEYIKREKLRAGFLPTGPAIASNLVFLYHICIATERLIKEAADEAEGALGDYYREHLKEETGEFKVLCADLDAAGINPGHPDSVSMAMIGTQYYMIKHINPVCFLGHLAVREADFTPLETVEALEETFGKEFFRFARMHAVRDVDHKEELLSVIDQQEERFQPLIWESAANTLMYFGMVSKTFGK